MKRIKQIRAIDPRKEFPGVQKIIYQLCHRFSNAYPVPYDECQSEAFVAYMYACKSYKSKMKFSSWVFAVVSWKLKDLVIRRSRERLSFIGASAQDWEEDPILAKNFIKPPAKDNVRDMLADLSEDAQDMVEMILETPRELVGLSMTPKQFLRKVKQHMEEWGYARQTLKNAERELHTRFQKKSKPSLLDKLGLTHEQVGKLHKKPMLEKLGMTPAEVQSLLRVHNFWGECSVPQIIKHEAPRENTQSPVPPLVLLANDRDVQNGKCAHAND